MIDWITCKVRCHHVKEIHDGSVLSMRPDGDVEWMTKRRKKVTGSFDSGIQIRTVTGAADPCSYLELSGNFTKFFQGHNLWGTTDLPALVYAMLEKLISDEKLGLIPTQDDRDSWLLDGISLSRVDINLNFSLGNRVRVLEWIRAAAVSAHLPFFGRGVLTKGSTLYFDKHSRRRSLKLYAKGIEIEAKGHEQHAILDLPHAYDYADGILRAELTLRGLELQRYGLRTVGDWLPFDGLPVDISAMLTKYLGAMTMTTTRTLPDEVFNTLFPAQRNAYLAWLAGNDLRTTMTKPSFYRMRSKLLPHGIDIAVCTPVESSNVIPMIRILEAMPAAIPDWAHGTSLYFEPRLVRRA